MIATPPVLEEDILAERFFQSSSDYDDDTDEDDLMLSSSHTTAEGTVVNQSANEAQQQTTNETTNDAGSIRIILDRTQPHMGVLSALCIVAQNRHVLHAAARYFVHLSIHHYGTTTLQEDTKLPALRDKQRLEMEKLLMFTAVGGGGGDGGMDGDENADHEHHQEPDGGGANNDDDDIDSIFGKKRASPSNQRSSVQGTQKGVVKDRYLKGIIQRHDAELAVLHRAFQENRVSSTVTLRKKFLSFLATAAGDLIERDENSSNKSLNRQQQRPGGNGGSNSSDVEPYWVPLIDADREDVVPAAQLCATVNPVVAQQARMCNNETDGPQQQQSTTNSNSTKSSTVSNNTAQSQSRTKDINLPPLLFDVSPFATLAEHCLPLYSPHAESSEATDTGGISRLERHFRRLVGGAGGPSSSSASSPGAGSGGGTGYSHSSTGHLSTNSRPATHSLLLYISPDEAELDALHSSLDTATCVDPVFWRPPSMGPHGGDGLPSSASECSNRKRMRHHANLWGCTISVWMPPPPAPPRRSTAGLDDQEKRAADDEDDHDDVRNAYQTEVRRWQGRLEEIFGACVTQWGIDMISIAVSPNVESSEAHLRRSRSPTATEEIVTSVLSAVATVHWQCSMTRLTPSIFSPVVSQQQVLEQQQQQEQIGDESEPSVTSDQSNTKTKKKKNTNAHVVHNGAPRGAVYGLAASLRFFLPANIHLGGNDSASGESDAQTALSGTVVTPPRRGVVRGGDSEAKLADLIAFMLDTVPHTELVAVRSV